VTEPVLEVIACSVADALEAQKGGASRLEVVRDLERGGMTPSLELVDRILSSGGSTELNQRIERLNTYAHAAAPELKMIAGGGIDSDAISFLKRTTSIREFHVGRAARSGFRVDGDVEAELVSRLVQVMREA